MITGHNMNVIISLLVLARILLLQVITASSVMELQNNARRIVRLTAYCLYSIKFYTGKYIYSWENIKSSFISPLCDVCMLAVMEMLFHGGLCASVWFMAMVLAI